MIKLELKFFIAWSENKKKAKMGNEAGKQKKFQKQMEELNEAAFQMKWQARSLEKEANKAMANKEAQMKKAKMHMDRGDMQSA